MVRGKQKTIPKSGKKKVRKTKVSAFETKTNKALDTDILFIGIDPGLRFPGYSVLKEDYSHILSIHIEGQGITGTDYERSFKISEMIIEELKKVGLDKNPLCLIIEGSSFTRGSSSLEQLAKCRQAAYDAFRSNPKLNLLYFIEVFPTEAKKTTTGNHLADKIEVFNWAKKMYPSVFSSIKSHFNTVEKTNTKRRKKKGDKKLTKKSENLADSLAICFSGLKRFKENNEEYFKI